MALICPWLGLLKELGPTIWKRIYHRPIKDDPRCPSFGPHPELWRWDAGAGAGNSVQTQFPWWRWTLGTPRQNGNCFIQQRPEMGIVLVLGGIKLVDISIGNRYCRYILFVCWVLYLLCRIKLGSYNVLKQMSTLSLLLLCAPRHLS